MEPVLLLFVALAAFLGLGWYRGGRANHALILTATQAMERAFAPIDTTYINIGGVVGYNFVYQLSPPFLRLEGTILTLPRHAILYLPISRWLLRREDTLLFTLYCGELRTGQGHIVEAERFKQGTSDLTIPAEDLENLSTTPAEYEERSFVILWYNPMVRDRLRDILNQFSPGARNGIRYLGYYGGEGHVACTVNPNAVHLEKTLREIRSVLSGAPAR